MIEDLGLELYLEILVFHFFSTAIVALPPSGGKEVLLHLQSLAFETRRDQGLIQSFSSKVSSHRKQSGDYVYQFHKNTGR